MTAKIYPLHRDCVVCLADQNRASAEEQTFTLLIMLRSGTPVDQIVGDLCPKHRRTSDDDLRNLP